MRALRHVVGVFLVALSFLTSPVSATSYSTDQSDLWYITTESGWGMQLVQRGNVIFATLFVYGQSTAPTWFVAQMGPTGSLQWSGALYATTGPWFGTVPFDPALVGVTQVGTMTWTGGPPVGQGTVTYSVNGVVVTKNVVRQTLVNDDYSGTYVGGITATGSGCSNPAQDGTTSGYVNIVISQSGSLVTVTVTDTSVNVLQLSGTLTQQGQFGSFTGTLPPVNYTVFEMNVQFNYFAARINFTTSPITGCTITAHLAGARK